MTDAPEVIIPTLLFKHLEDIAFSQPVPISFPDVPFVPPAGTWIAVDYLPNRNRAPFAASDAETLFRGLLQAAVVTPRGSGALRAARIAAEIAAHFEAQVLWPDDESFKLHINGRPDIGGAIQEENWTKTPVTISWRAVA